VNTRVFVILAGGAVAVWAFRRWRLGLQAAMVLLVFEGAVRKWLFPGSQDLVYFAKDVLLLGTYLGYVRDRPRLRNYRPPSLPTFYGVLLLSAVLGLLEIFNPALPNLLVGVFGFKAYFLYVPLLFVVPAAFATDAELYRFLRRYALISIPVGLLAVLQFFSPSSSLLNTYARTNEEIDYVVTFGSSIYVRVTATFSFITGYTSYLLVSAILILCLLAAAGWKFRGQLLLVAALGFTALGMLMTGSRGPVLMVALLFPLYWWLAVIRERGGGGAFGRLVIALTLIGVLLVSTGREVLDAFIGRAAGVGDVRGRLTSPLLSPFVILPDAGLLGFGIGATHQTAAALAPSLMPYSWLHGLITEVESGRVMLEMGALGFVFIYLFRIYLIVYAFRQVMVLRTRFHRALATASCLVAIAAVPNGVVFDVTSDLYYWFFAGVLLLVVRLDRQKATAGARAKPSRPTAVEPRLEPAAPVAG
jgi:hypothetical protein